MSTISLPHSRTALVDANGRATREFYQFFQSTLGNLQEQIDALADIVKLATALGSPDGTTQDLIDVQEALDAKADAIRVVTGAFSIKGGGSLEDDIILKLDGDKTDPGTEMVYGTDADGNRGWQPTAIPSFATTDNLIEGADNLYFTDERAQDAVGGILAESADIALAYDDAAPAITPTLKTTGVAAGTYGDATHVARVTFDANGRATAVASVAISASGGGSGGVPYLIADGAVFTVPANQQLPWMVPGELDGSGSLDIEGALVEVA